MELLLQFDYSSSVVYIPDGYVYSIEQLQEDFLDWVSDQPECWVNGPGHIAALSYGKEEFLAFVNDVILMESKEKAYFISDAHKHSRARRILRF